MSQNENAGLLAQPLLVEPLRVCVRYLPVPVKGTCCGLFAALSVIVTSPERDPVWVGVKVTLILQFLPAASVALQGFELVAKAKSPLATMLPMFSVAVPVLARLVALPALVTPTVVLGNASEAGVRVTTGPLPLAVTVRLTVVAAVKLPDVPVMVTVDVPVVADAVAVSVSVLVEVVGFGLNPAVTLLGRPEALKLTLPVKPFNGLTVTVLVPLPPCATLTLVGEAESVKFGDEEPASALIRPVPFGLPQPVAKS